MSDGKNPKNQHSELSASRPEFARTVLLTVSGLSPAIISETVWALAHEPVPTIPDEVVVLTTTQGADDIQRQLLTPSSVWADATPWSALRRCVLGRAVATDNRLQLAGTRVIELPDASGVKVPAKDLRTRADNDAAADFILEEVRRLTENPDVRVIASIAGGRKTMGALLYAAMSLLGRETDRLTHVLVNEPFDQCRDFFFPDQPVQNLIAGRDRIPVKAADARPELADIPFVPLRNLFERDLARRPGSFAQLVVEASNRLPSAPPKRVEVRTAEPLIVVDGVAVRFSPKEHALVLLLAERCKGSMPLYPNHPAAHTEYQSLAGVLREKVGDSISDWRYGLSDCKSVSDEDLRKIIHQIRGKLVKAGDAGRKLDKAIKSRGALGIELDADIIQIV